MAFPRCVKRHFFVILQPELKMKNIRLKNEQITVF